MDSPSKERAKSELTTHDYFDDLTDHLIRRYYIEQTTGATGNIIPDVPAFSIDRVPSEGGYGKAKVTWHPNYAGTPGSHFYTQYRKVGEPSWLKTEPQISEDHIEVGSLESDENYEFEVVSVDGNHETRSAPQFFDISGSGKIDDETAVKGQTHE